VCVCERERERVCVCVSMYTHTHTHTHTQDLPDAPHMCVDMQYTLSLYVHIHALSMYTHTNSHTYKLTPNICIHVYRHKDVAFNRQVIAYQSASTWMSTTIIVIY
jgi:hypothetical protein